MKNDDKYEKQKNKRREGKKKEHKEIKRRQNANDNIDNKVIETTIEVKT